MARRSKKYLESVTVSRLEQIRAAASKGGKKTSRLYGKKFKEQRAQSGGQACLIRYGRQYYQNIRAMRTA